MIKVFIIFNNIKKCGSQLTKTTFIHFRRRQTLEFKKNLKQQNISDGCSMMKNNKVKNFIKWKSFTKYNNF